MRKRRVVGRIYGVKYSRKDLKDRNRHKNRIKKEGASSVGLRLGARGDLISLCMDITTQQSTTTLHLRPLFFLN